MLMLFFGLKKYQNVIKVNEYTIIQLVIFVWQSADKIALRKLLLRLAYVLVDLFINLSLK